MRYESYGRPLVYYHFTYAIGWAGSPRSSSARTVRGRNCAPAFLASASSASRALIAFRNGLSDVMVWKAPQAKTTRLTIALACRETSATASIGITVTDPAVDPANVRPADLLRKADAATYEAKPESKARRAGLGGAGTRDPRRLSRTRPKTAYERGKRRTSGTEPTRQPTSQGGFYPSS